MRRFSGIFSNFRILSYNSLSKRCSKPEAYCLSPLGGPKYKEKKTREARLGLESMFRIIDPSPIPIPDRQSKMHPGGFGDFLKSTKKCRSKRMRGAAKCSFCESRSLCAACRLRSRSRCMRFGGLANF